MIHCSGIQSKSHALKVQGALFNNSVVRPDSFVCTSNEQRYYVPVLCRPNAQYYVGPPNSLAIHSISMFTYVFSLPICCVCAVVTKTTDFTFDFSCLG